MVIVSQYMQILTHYVVHLQLICYMSIQSQLKKSLENGKNFQGEILNDRSGQMKQERQGAVRIINIGQRFKSGFILESW